MKIPINNTINYRNFGFIPNRDFKHDMLGKILGHPNLAKRLQAKDIIKALNIHSNDYVLDFGCGMGYFTIEMVKVASHAYGIDTNPYIETIQIPSDLEEKLKYIKTSGDKLPFEACFFDRILASEIILTTDNPDTFLREMHRVIKANGNLVVVNGTGHPAIEQAYNKPGCFFNFLKTCYVDRMPNSYDEYCEILHKSFGNFQKRFLNETDIRDLLSRNGFEVVSVSHSPGYLAGAFFSWSQFILYLRTGKTLSQNNFFFYYGIFSFIRLFEKKTYLGGLIIVAQKKG